MNFTTYHSKEELRRIAAYYYTNYNPLDDAEEFKEEIEKHVRYAMERKSYDMHEWEEYVIACAKKF